MSHVHKLVPNGEQARRIMGDAAFASAVEGRRRVLDALLHAVQVRERWKDGRCVSCMTADGIDYAPGLGFDAGYFGKLIGIVGSEPEIAVANWVTNERESPVDDGVRERILVWFYVEYGEDFITAFARAEKRLIDAIPGMDRLPSRMHVELESRVGVMWLQLRGRLFWNPDFKDLGGLMFYDINHNLGNGRHGGYLMKIQSDDFRTWYASHAPSKASVMKRDSPLLALVNMAAMNPDTSSGVVPGNLWDRRGNAIYVSCGDSMMVKVTAEGCELVANGSDDVVFMAGKTLREWNLLDGDGEDPFDGTLLFSGANYKSPHGKMLVRLWFLGLFACLRAKPALVFTGRWRSGKTRSAEGISELLGVRHRCAAIQEKGEDDFWVSVNEGGIVCFDNVDTKTNWFGDAMQLACTKGSKEKRKLYSEEIRSFEAKSAIMLTANNPLFASESGLTDRCQICRLEALTVESGKVTSDRALSDDIEARRDAALTWAVRTVSRALRDAAPVAENINMRHPDYATFVLKCARSIGMYDEAVAAMKSAEFDKALFTLQNDRVANYVFEIVKMASPASVRVPDGMPAGYWHGTSSDMLVDIRKTFGVDEHDRAVNARTVGKVMNKFFDQLSMCFTAEKPRVIHGRSQYSFTGFSAAFAQNVGVDDDSVDTSAPSAECGGDSSEEDEPLEF